MYELKDSNGKVVASITAETPDQIQCESGVWMVLKTEDGTKPTLCVVKKEGGWYLGFYRDTHQAPIGCDLAISFEHQSGPVLQIAKGNEVVMANLLDFVKDDTKKTGG